jgi:hypothetical protein
MDEDTSENLLCELALLLTDSKQEVNDLCLKDDLEVRFNGKHYRITVEESDDQPT